MRKLLIAEQSEEIIAGLQSELKDQWNISVCTDGYTAIDTLRYLEPDAMIINLSLPQKDGISVLEECFPVLPPVILALTSFTSHYIERTASELGVGYILQKPCQINQIIHRLTDMYLTYHSPKNAAARHLKAMQMNTSYSGYRCLLVAIPAFKEDPSQLLQKEIYPLVAQECELNDERCVERVIRFAIRDAWERRNIRIWSHYFPQNEIGDVDFPGNKDFIKRISEMI